MTILTRGLTEHETRTVLWVCVLAVVLVAALTWLGPLVEEATRLVAAWVSAAHDPIGLAR